MLYHTAAAIPVSYGCEDSNGGLGILKLYTGRYISLCVVFIDFPGPYRRGASSAII